MASYFTATPKRWGRSLGIVIPKDIVEKEGIAASASIKVVVFSNPSPMKKYAGLLKDDPRTMDEAMRIVDEGEEDG